jgi:M6 family metalloprotease-like protein
MILQKRLVIILLFIPLFFLSGKIELQKMDSALVTRSAPHALEQHFGRTGTREALSGLRSENSNRLLVMMIDFVEDNDPSTTGNGKFLFSDSDYPIDLGKPPHNQEYFWWVMESVRHYYLAASLGFFDLEFDIYPQVEYSASDTVIIAYTLPQEMSYYNPPGAGTELMISRFEEYFHDVFTTVDEDEEVDFSQYGHFMIIHAGSDSQHDIAGDTRSDIPSFFIHVGDGKEVIVDDGIVIDKACNVPATISQDGQYGLTTAVTAHEFGHSLGFIDLYSTLTGAPQVGWFDIMDSGGAGELIVDIIDGEYITIGGGLPTLPNAWHRILAWEEEFRSHGILRDIDELDWQEPIRVSPAEKKPSEFGNNLPYFIKVPLTDKEYLLIENRQVDPDGDSGLSFKGALPQYPHSSYKGYRHLLYPTYPAPDPRDDPNWEYDLFIPGWQKETADRIYNYGGGLVIWHIDDSIIYEEGSWEGGEFYSNYASNTVNALRTRRGIKVIEADGFNDIGNYNDGYNILGSAYDPFYRYYPRLSESGNFLGWNNQGLVPGYQPKNEDEYIHIIEFNGASSPRLQTNTGEPFMFGFWDISSYSVEANVERVMSFRYGSHLFDEMQIISSSVNIRGLSDVVQIYGLESFALISDDNISLLTLIGDEWGDQYNFQVPFAGEISQPLTCQDIDGDTIEEILIISENIMYMIDGLEISQQEFSSSFSDAPLLLNHKGQKVSVFPLEDMLLLDEEELAISGARLSYDGEHLVAADQDRVWFIDPTDGAISQSYFLSGGIGPYYPIISHLYQGESHIYIASENGDIYRMTAEEKKLIFRIMDFTDALPTQLMLTRLEEDGRSWLVFAAGEYLFAITEDGTLAEGYPVYLENRAVSSGSWLQTMYLNGEYIIMMRGNLGNRIALNGNGDYRSMLTSISAGDPEISNYWYDEIYQTLSWFGDDGRGNLLRGQWNNLSENPVICRGYRNNGNNSFTAAASVQSDTLRVFSAFAFPNPAKAGHAIVRVYDAEGEIELKLYDIAGNLLLREIEALEANPYQDIGLNIGKLSSGIYFARIKSNSKMLTVPLGIEK